MNVLLVAIFWSILSLGSEKSLQITCLTSKCHSDMIETKFVHSPLKANGCLVCHSLGPSLKNSRLPTTHPNISVDMGKNQLAICQKCHVEWGRGFSLKRNQHSLVKQKGCTSCHNPHGSQFKKLLRTDPLSQELCTKCHKFQGEVSHKALFFKERCLNCHDAHASDFPKHLKKAEATLCIECHKGIDLINNRENLHSPIKKGECHACHSPHSSSEKNLLNKKFNSNSYPADLNSSYELCLSCHQVEKQTEFRNGDKNLHRFHLQGEKRQRGCSVCHDVHQTKQPMLIKSEFSYDKYLMPLEYQKSGAGGGCTTACHGLKEYDRINSIENKKVKK